jgi:hypothetical protein
MMENDGLAGSPVLEVDRGAVAYGDGVYEMSPCDAKLEWSAAAGRVPDFFH